jgi:hypothetical protein
MDNLSRVTRIPCAIRLRLSALDSPHAFFEPCLVVLVKPQGYGLRFGSAHVMNCISIGQYEKFWFVGLSLDESDNFVGIETRHKISSGSRKRGWSRSLSEAFRKAAHSSVGQTSALPVLIRWTN